ncbi:MAG: transporter [Hespellia sp.]|nr:transporter [Hespellia sp.]
MKRNIFSILCVLFFLIMLIRPREVFLGAQDGLLLWFQIVLPTLLPFLIITNLLFHTNGLHYITRAVSPVICPLFGVSETAGFAVIAGFLCGYPLGAKTTADLLRQRFITEQEAQYLLSFCNNTSPMFILNFIVWKTLKNNALMLPTLLILYASPILMSFLFRKFYRIGKPIPANTSPKQNASEFLSPSSGGFDIVDDCIMNGFEAIVKVGGYIILFSVILTLLSNTGLPDSSIGNYLLASLEITNGITLLGSLQTSWTYPAILTLTSFGGFCAAAQTKCMLQGTSLKIMPYILQKLVTALATSILTVLFLNVILL